MKKDAKKDGKPEHGRASRVAERVREELSTLIGRELSDPRVLGVIISNVRMTDDLRLATVRFRLLEGGDDAARQKTATIGLTRASGMLRREITQRAGLRFAPELRFFYDAGLDATTRIEEILYEVNAEKKAK